jgi:hypothetical protein
MYVPEKCIERNGPFSLALPPFAAGLEVTPKLTILALVDVCRGSHRGYRLGTPYHSYLPFSGEGRKV